MPFYFKPVVYNKGGYLRPAGGPFSSGYPRDHGYGHEEWNNSPKFSYAEGADRFKVFHTEGLGNLYLDEQAGLIALVLIASNAGKQWLIAVAAGCMPLLSEKQKSDREKLAERLGLDSKAMANETWRLRSVNSAFENDEQRFRRHWETDFHWIPNWTCPADLYLALPEPIQIDAQPLTGKKRLVAMYGSYQPIDRLVFQRVLAQIPTSSGHDNLVNIKSWAGGDIDAAKNIKDVRATTVTERAALIQARIGQGAFRAGVMEEWSQRCAVTGTEIQVMVRASHVMPWSVCNNAQRLDAQNGLPLVAHLDALFDAGLISFSDTGEMLVASSLRNAKPEIWGLGSALMRKPKERLLQYLEYHRKVVFSP